MSKDAQLLRAMGMGPEERPELWAFPYTLNAFPAWDLGLDLDPSEWTVEHDAAFARVVWPWLRRYVWHSENLADLETSLVELMQIDDCMGTWQKEPFGIWATGSANPGPTMCQAIYNVLCGEDGK